MAKYPDYAQNLHPGPHELPSVQLVRGVAPFTRPTTIKSRQAVTGVTESYIVETARHEDGDHILLESIDAASGVVRLALPPKVANAIAAQRESLTARRRSIAAKAQAQSRKERGELPGFVKKRRDRQRRVRRS